MAPHFTTCVVSCWLLVQYPPQLVSLPNKSPCAAGTFPAAPGNLVGALRGKSSRRSISQVLRIRGGEVSEEDENEEGTAETHGGGVGVEGTDQWLDEYFPEHSRKEW
jgi:hypothetical protein